MTNPCVYNKYYREYNHYTGYTVFNLAPQALHVYRGASRGVLTDQGEQGTNLHHDVPTGTLPV